LTPACTQWICESFNPYSSVRKPDLLAYEIGDILDPGAFAHEQRGLPEHARREHGERDEIGLSVGRERDIFREGDFRNIPFLVHEEAVEDFLDLQIEQAKIDAFRLHAAHDDVAHMVVIGHRPGQG
jgi:hypothetical protein